MTNRYFDMYFICYYFFHLFLYANNLQCLKCKTPFKIYTTSSFFNTMTHEINS